MRLPPPLNSKSHEKLSTFFLKKFVTTLMTTWLHLMLMSQKSLWLRRIAKSAGPCPTARCPGAKPDTSPTRSNLDRARMTCPTLQLAYYLAPALRRTSRKSVLPLLMAISTKLPLASPVDELIQWCASLEPDSTSFVLIRSVNVVSSPSSKARAALA